MESLWTFQNDFFSLGYPMKKIAFLLTFHQKKNVAYSTESTHFHKDYVVSVSCSFNGKEKDYESGFHYYGARYYWSEVLTGWLSVDPMMDKYPGISPYNYCAWNPVGIIDPNGMDTTITMDLDSRSVSVNSDTKKIGFGIEQIESGNRTSLYSSDKSCSNVSSSNRRTIISFDDPQQAREIYDIMVEMEVPVEWNLMYLVDGSADLVTSGMLDLIRMNPEDYSMGDVSMWRHYHPYDPNYLYWKPSKKDQQWASILGKCPAYLDFCGQSYNFEPIIRDYGVIEDEQYNRYRDILKKVYPDIRPYCR